MVLKSIPSNTDFFIYNSDTSGYFFKNGIFLLPAE